MNVTDYWPMAREYSIWNAVVAALQFWTANLKAHVLSSTIEQVYNAFFYTTFMHLLCDHTKCSLWEETHLGRWRLWEWKWKFQHTHSSQTYSQTPPCIQWWQHLLWPTTPHSTGTSHSHHKPIQCQLSFSTSDDEDSSTDDIPTTYSSTPPLNLLGFAQQTHYKPFYTVCDDQEKDEEEDFQTVPLEGDHWATEEIPDRHLCIHKHSAPHLLCPYPCPYMDYLYESSTLYHSMLDLSDISEFKDLMTTSSDEDIPGLDDEIGYWNP